MKIVELLIDELEDIMGFDAVALVHSPAHEAEFHAFDSKDVDDAIAFQLIKQAVLEHMDIDAVGLPDYTNEATGSIIAEEFESFNNYPESATNAAKRALKWRDEHPDNDCGTRVGWARANQLANRENISEETIARMASFARHLQYEDVPYSEGCGGLMVDAWGGRAGIEWASNKLESIREGLSQEFSSEKYEFALDGEQQMVVGPLMIPEKLIFRVDQNNEPYYVYFSKETIKQIAQKMMKEKLLDRVNLEHDPDSPIESHMVESWLVEDRLKDKQQAYGFDHPVGTWMGMYKIESPVHWEMAKQGKVKGFSIEAFLTDKLIQK